MKAMRTRSPRQGAKVAPGATKSAKAWVEWEATVFEAYTGNIELDVRRDFGGGLPWRWRATPSTISGPAWLDSLGDTAETVPEAMRMAEAAARRLTKGRQ